MAKKTYKKMNYAKFLPKAGSTFAVAMAMTVALSTQANAAETEGIPTPPSTDIPPVNNETGTPAPTTETPIDPVQTNADIQQSNENTVAENNETGSDNLDTQQKNDEAIQNNENTSGGKLGDPNLPDLPDAPDAPDTEGQDTEGYNDAVDQYNDQVDGYNDQVDAYNDAVDGYNADAEAYNKDQKDQYDTNMGKYVESEQYHAGQQTAYNEEYQAYLNSEEYQDYLTLEKAFTEKWSTYEAELNSYKEYLNSEEYQQALAQDAKYQQYLKDKAAYEAAEPKQEAHEKETEIYNNVSSYNADIEKKNEEITKQNQALTDDVSAEDVDSITDVGTINAGVKVDENTMNTLKTYDALVKAQGKLEEDAAALENHEGKDADLGSEAYNLYLEAVKTHNKNVQDHNALVTAYNEAAKTYNDAVKDFNDEQDANAGTSSTTGSQTGTGTADWGNVSIKNKYLNHIDVKYTAAVAKDKTVDADGSETSSESATQYTVVGVYVDETAAKVHEEAKKDPRYNENKDGIKYYGVSYKNNDESNTQTHSIQKDAANHEFGNPSHTGARMNPGEGYISFYMTLQSGTTTQGIQVTMDANSVYPDGTYYHAASDDRLDLYVDSKGNELQTVTIDGVEYYDISGQSVFVISALTCDGMSENGHWEGSGKNRKWVVDSLTPNGLDLVVNVETLISITQANHAQNIKYLDLQMGKTAQAEKPGDIEILKKPDDVTPATFRPAPVEPTDPEPVKPEYKGTPDPGEFQGTRPSDPSYVSTLSRAEELEKLENKVIFELGDPDPIPDPTPDPTPDPNPDPIPTPAQPNYPVMVLDLDDGLIEIEDEDVPLAKAPKTGDISSLLLAMSLASGGAFTMLNRKRKDEEE